MLALCWATAGGPRQGTTAPLYRSYGGGGHSDPYPSSNRERETEKRRLCRNGKRNPAPLRGSRSRWGAVPRCSRSGSDGGLGVFKGKPCWGLPRLGQFISCCTILFCILIPIISRPILKKRLTFVLFTLMNLYFHLSISYESIFIIFLAFQMMSWLLVESFKYCGEFNIETVTKFQVYKI